jgi:RHS repeat-associated protein
VRLSLDDTGTPLPTALAYSPFGLPQSGTLPAPFGFTGELHHNDLVYLRARWYDPGNGTFTSVDPFDGFDTLPYSLHPYQYAYSDPVVNTDPTGLCTGLCETLQRLMTKRYGITFGEGKCDWTLDELRLVNDGIKQLITTASWDNARFRNAIGSVTFRRLKYVPPLYDLFNHGATTETGLGGTSILFYDKSFPAWDPEWTSSTTAHELAHVWDIREGFQLTRQLAERVQADKTAECYQAQQTNPWINCFFFEPTQIPASDYGGTNGREDWAVSVEAVTYPHRDEFPSWIANPSISSLRVSFVHTQFRRY